MRKVCPKIVVLIAQMDSMEKSNKVANLRQL